MISIDSTAKAYGGSISSSNLADEVVILNTNNGTYYGLDAVGALVWKLIQQPRQVSEIRDAILEEYEVEPERCEQDLLDLLQKLTDEGLIEIS